MSLFSFLALGAGIVVASEVRAGGPHGLNGDDLPVAAMVDQGTLDQAHAFDGEWVFSGGQKQRDGIDAAIETSMAAVNPVVRSLGRKRLQETNTVPKLLKIAVRGDAVEISFDGDGHTAKLDGKPIKTQSKQGDKIKVSHGVRGSKLFEFIDGVGGDRLNEFKLNDEGNRLSLKVKISSGHLPVPVEYHLSFKRK